MFLLISRPGTRCFAFLFLAGCSAQAPLPEAPRAIEGQYKGAPRSPDLQRPSSEWWREFSSAELNRLQDAALANNRDLQAAIARVAQANAQARVTESAQFPSVEASGRREAEGPRVGVGLAETKNEWDQLNRYRVGARVNYEADLWGKSGYATESALAQALASVHQRETVALTMTADLATAYLEYLSLGERRAISDRAVVSRRNQLLAVDKRLQRGDATALEVTQLRVTVATAESASAAFQQRHERTFNRIAVLAGTTPAELKLEANGLAGLGIPAIDPGLPSELLCRRPDVRRLEAQLLAAEFDVRSLRASLLPSFSLLGEIGFGSRHLAALSNPASLFFLATGGTLQSVFDAGRKEGQIELARAKHLELLHQYTGTLQTALRDVEDALAATRLTGEQHRATVDASRAAQANYVLNRRSYEVGAVDYVQLLESEQRAVNAEDSEAAALHDRMRAAVDLFRALGGGTRPPSGGACGK